MSGNSKPNKKMQLQDLDFFETRYKRNQAGETSGGKNRQHSFPRVLAYFIGAWS
jgi:hypothetical protein